MREKAIGGPPDVRGIGLCGRYGPSEARLFEGGPRWQDWRYIGEENVATLRQVEVLCGQDNALTDAVRAIGATEVTYYRLRNECRGLRAAQVKRPMELDREYARFRRCVFDDCRVAARCRPADVEVSAKAIAYGLGCFACQDSMFCLNVEKLARSNTIQPASI